MPETMKTPAPGAVKPVAASAAPAPVTKAETPAKSPAVAKTSVVAKTAPVETPRRKRGRPLGAKSKPKAAAARPTPVAKTVKPQTVKPKTITPSVAPIAAATSAGSKTMNDTITTIQDTAKTFTGEATARAKGAYEKSLKIGEEMTEFQKGNVEAMVESSKLAAKAVETLGQEAADYARKSFETGTTAFKSFASAKSPTELFKLQSDYVKSYFDSAVAESSKMTEAWLKIAGEVAQPLSNRMAVAVDKVKVAAAF